MNLFTKRNQCVAVSGVWCQHTLNFKSSYLFTSLWCPCTSVLEFPCFVGIYNVAEQALVDQRTIPEKYSCAAFLQSFLWVRVLKAWRNSALIPLCLILCKPNYLQKIIKKLFCLFWIQLVKVKLTLWLTQWHHPDHFCIRSLPICLSSSCSSRKKRKGDPFPTL